MKAIRLAFVIVAFYPAWLWAGQLVVFGDSLSDLGNVYTDSSNNPSIQADPPSPPYYQGRMSNGPIWVDYLADMIGVPHPVASLNGGTGYAYAGAYTDAGTRVRPSIALPGQTQVVSNIGKQIDDFLVANSGFTQDQIVLLWGGANDLLRATLAGQVNGQAIVTNSIANLESELRTLDTNGAQRVLVPNQIDASIAPFFNGFGPALPPDVKGLLAAFTGSFNAQLDAMLDSLIADPSFQLQVDQVDMFGFFESILSDPLQFGFTNASTPAFIPGVGVTPDPAGYLFWDVIHPTTEAHRLIAQAAFLAIPIPGTLPLLAIGALAGWFPVLRRFC